MLDECRALVWDVFLGEGRKEGREKRLRGRQECTKQRRLQFAIHSLGCTFSGFGKVAPSFEHVTVFLIVILGPFVSRPRMNFGERSHENVAYLCDPQKVGIPR